MMMTVISYETKKRDKYLAYYTYKSVEEAQKEADALNTEKPTKMWNGEKIDWNEINRFYVKRQEEMY